MFILLIIVLVSRLYTYVKIYQLIHFKYVYFILCHLYPNRVVKNIHRNVALTGVTQLVGHPLTKRKAVGSFLIKAHA